MSSENNTVACAQCGQPITGESPSGDSAQRKPCPNCGSTARTFSVHAQSSIGLSAIAQAEVITYPQTLLSIARSLIDKGEFSIGVVVAHMACEVATERALSESFTQKGIKDLRDPVYALLNGYNLANDKVRKLYTALTNDEIHLQPFWNGFKESATRRNRIIHDGATVEKTEAEDSYKAARDLVAHLNTRRTL